jgi:hypothetical protein
MTFPLRTSVVVVARYLPSDATHFRPLSRCAPVDVRGLAPDRQLTTVTLCRAAFERVASFAASKGCAPHGLCELAGPPIAAYRASVAVKHRDRVATLLHRSRDTRSRPQDGMQFTAQVQIAYDIVTAATGLRPKRDALARGE